MFGVFYDRNPVGWGAKNALKTQKQVQIFGQ